MQLKDVRKLFLGMNLDDDPSLLQQGEFVNSLNGRVASSDQQHGIGPWETLQGEIEIQINAIADITYYGEAIGGQFSYHGYEEVAIGTQVWMKKNWDYNYPGSKVYDDLEANRAIYGGLYTHQQIMESDFVPAGWHVPTEAEIDTLLTYLGGAAIAGGKMKEPNTTRWLTPNTGADDSSGFKGLPGGRYDSAFDLLAEMGLFWIEDEEKTEVISVDVTGDSYALSTKASFLHGSLYYNGHIYGSPRNSDPVSGLLNIFKINAQDYSDYLNIEIRYASDVDNRSIEYAEQIKRVGTYIYTQGFQPFLSSLLLIQINSADDTYKIFKVGNDFAGIGSYPIHADDTHIYYPFLSGATDLVIKKFLATDFQSGLWTKFETAIDTPIVPVATLTHNLVGTFNLHAICDDADYLYLSMIQGLVLGNPSKLLKVDKVTMTVVATADIPYASDDIDQNTTHVFLGSEAALGNYNYEWATIAVRKSDMNVTGLLKHSTESSLYRSYGVKILNIGGVDYLFNLRTSKTINVINISNPDSWSVLSSSDPFIEKILSFSYNDTPVVHWSANEILLDIYGKLHIFNWTLAPEIIKFNSSSALVNSAKILQLAYNNAIATKTSALKIYYHSLRLIKDSGTINPGKESYITNVLLNGKCIDSETRCLYVFYIDTYFGSAWIIEFNLDTRVQTVVYYDKENAIGFDANYKIYNARVVHGRLIWTDNKNPIYQMDIERAKKSFYYKIGYTGYSATAEWNSVTNYGIDQIVSSGNYFYKSLIAGNTATEPGTDATKWEQLCLIEDAYYSQTVANFYFEPVPPKLPPTVEYVADDTRRINSLRQTLFQVAYRYIYMDWRKSTFSPASLVHVPQAEEETATGLANEQPSLNNSLKITVNTGGEEVRQIEVVGRSNTDPSKWYIIETIDKFSVEERSGEVSILTDLAYAGITITILDPEVVNVEVPSASIASGATNIFHTSFQANWASCLGATGYFLDVATDAAFTSFVAGYNNKSVAGLNDSVTGLTEGTTYYYRVRATNIAGTSINSGTITVVTTAAYEMLYDHEFTIAAPGGGSSLRWYYVMADTAPYNALTYLDYVASILLHADHGQWTNDVDLICARTIAGSAIPNPHPSFPTHTWARVCAVIYDNTTGKYRKYSITEAIGNGILVGLYRVDPAMGYAYYLNYEKDLAGWPTSLTDL